MKKNEVYKYLDLSYKTALVTGGAGFIGSHICEELLKNTSLNVISIDNYSAGKKRNINHLRSNKKFIEKKIDILNEKNINILFDEYDIDIIFHQAA